MEGLLQDPGPQGQSANATASCTASGTGYVGALCTSQLDVLTGAGAAVSRAAAQRWWLWPRSRCIFPKCF